MFLEIATISLAFSINFFKSLKATVMLSSVCLCCSSMLLSIPTIPERIFELTGCTEGLDNECELAELTGDITGVGLSHALAETASLSAL